ncbi:hypothetical protein KPH14_013095, partial [Odynerus spinipes]
VDDVNESPVIFSRGRPNNDKKNGNVTTNHEKDRSNNNSRSNKVRGQNCQTLKRAICTTSQNSTSTSIDLNFSVKMLDWLLCILDNDENFSNLWTCLKSSANFEESTTNYDTPV